jgi:putative PIN family toxin of toxin-antitoxin system
MPASRIRIIIDTNWWISISISKMRNEIVNQVILNDDFELYASRELDIEVMDMINKSHLRKLFQLHHYFEFLYYYAGSTILFPVTSSVTVCRDPNDNFLLALAKDAKANFLITGDKDLLCLKRFEQTLIVSFPEFQAIDCIK